MNIFSMDNAFFRFVGRVTDLVWLNILTLICCIPVFTAGAAISSMYRVLILIAINQDSGITKMFFKTFKSNFKDATKVWIPSLLIIVALFANAYLIYHGVLDSYGGALIASGVSIGVIASIMIMFLNYCLAMISRYDNTVGTNVKNAFLLMVAYFPQSFCILVISLSPIALMMLSDTFLYLWFLYGLSFPAFFNSMLLGKVFLRTEAATQNGQEDV